MMVISVPHSGTRSLCTELGLAHGHGNFDYWHWGQNDADINAYEGEAHIPLRNPIDIAKSWDARYPNEHDSKGPEELCRRLDLMWEYIHSRDVKVHRIEDLHTDIGNGPEKRETSPHVEAVKKWLEGGKIGFYQEFYEL